MKNFPSATKPGRVGTWPWLLSCLSFGVGVGVGVGACAPSTLPSPHTAAKQYARAAEKGDADALYAMMTLSAQRARGKEAVATLVRSEARELGERGRDLGSNGARIESVARLRFDDGEEAVLQLSNDGFRVSAAGLLPGGASTPEQALDQLRRALARRSYPALLRVLSPATRAAVEHDLRSLVIGLERPSALPIEVLGESANVVVTGGHRVKLRRENGIWRVEDFD